jgi:hypothetical protein
MNAMTTIVPVTPQGVAVSVKSAMPNLKDLILVRGTVNGNVVVAPDTDNPLLRDAVRRSGIRVQISDALKKGRYVYTQSNGRFYVRGRRVPV